MIFATYITESIPNTYAKMLQNQFKWTTHNPKVRSVNVLSKQSTAEEIEIPN